MHLTHNFTRTLCLFAAMSFLSIPAARAAYTITVDQVGPDVVATGSGALNTSGMSILVDTTTQSGVQPIDGGVFVGPTTFQDTSFIQTISGPASFGSGAYTVADSGSGATVGVVGVAGLLVVPENYVGGDLGTSTTTWNNQTLSTLGLTPGIYTYNLPSDTFTVNIVPEPASFSLLAFAGLATLRRSRQP